MYDGGWTGVQDVVGISPDVRGGRLGVRLLRSVLTLGVYHLFRFGFAVGTAQVDSVRLTLLQLLAYLLVDLAVWLVSSCVFHCVDNLVFFTLSVKLTVQCSSLSPPS